MIQSDTHNGTCPYCNEQLPSDWEMHAIEQRRAGHEIKLETHQHRFSEGHPLTIYRGATFRLLVCYQDTAPRTFWQCPGSKERPDVVSAQVKTPDEMFPRGTEHAESRTPRRHTLPL